MWCDARISPSLFLNANLILFWRSLFIFLLKPVLHTAVRSSINFILDSNKFENYLWMVFFGCSFFWLGWRVWWRKMDIRNNLTWSPLGSVHKHMFSSVCCKASLFYQFKSFVFNQHSLLCDQISCINFFENLCEILCPFYTRMIRNFWFDLPCEMKIKATYFCR